MTNSENKQKNFNFKLYLSAFFLSAVVILQLYLAANKYDNWAGFYYSLLHVLLVAGACVFALKRK